MNSFSSVQVLYLGLHNDLLFLAHSSWDGYDANLYLFVQSDIHWTNVWWPTTMAQYSSQHWTQGGNISCRPNCSHTTFALLCFSCSPRAFCSLCGIVRDRASSVASVIKHQTFSKQVQLVPKPRPSLESSDFLLWHQHHLLMIAVALNYFKSKEQKRHFCKEEV